MHRIIPIALTVAACLPSFVLAQCTSGTEPFQDLLDHDVTEIVRQRVPDLVDKTGKDTPRLAAVKAARDTPRQAALAQQTSAPSVVGTFATLVDNAGFTELISAAFDRNVGTNGSDALTLNVNPFSVAAIGKPSVYYDQSEYEKREYEWLRRVSGTASFGGSGDSFDRDGDGKPDPALDSEQFGDIVGWEVRARVYGSRDRRDPENFKKFEAAVGEMLAEIPAKKQALIADPRLQAMITREHPTLCFSDAQWKELKKQPWFAERFAAVVDVTAEANRRYAAAADEIDNQMLWTVAMTGLQREKKFGPDKLGASVRGTWKAATFNFDWKSVEGLGNEKTSNEFKVGAQYATQILKNGFFTDGIDASASGAFEAFDNVAEEKHDNNVKFQGKLEIPIMNGVSIPISVTWANHSDQLNDGDHVFGHLGVNVDLSKLLQRDQLAASGS